MSGDLGALLTGEMGEAEARFAHDDFAGACGRRVAQRVRRRRTARAVGAGGGTALTAGALAVGATHVPWGLWGTAAVQPGATDCASASPGVFTYTYRSLPSEPTRVADGTVTWTDARGVDVTLSQDADGTWWVTRGTDTPKPVMPNDDGDLTVVTADGATVVTIAAANAVSGEELASTIRYTVESDPEANADDCYTPSPTASASVSASASASPSPDPTLAAKPEEFGGSPFECGFEFPTESYGTDALSIDDAEWFTREDVDSLNPESSGRSVTWGSTSPDALVPRVTVHHDIPTLGEGETATGVVDTGEPSVEKLSGNPAEASTVYHYSKGRTFVGVRDGKVVATGTHAEDPPKDPAAIFTARDGFGSLQTELMYLIDPGVALTSCDAEPLDLEQLDIVAVAGLLVQHQDGTSDPTVYAWAPVGKP